jgi:L-ribulose-5-phosphate 3-epimerase
MYLGYNTNGLVHHDLFDAVELLAGIGYRGVAITIDHNALSPRDNRTGQQLERLRSVLAAHDMRSVIETGARFLLDPSRKHEPTLLSSARRRRIEFYRHAIDCAAALQSDCVSLWSGALNEAIPRVEAIDRLVEGLHEVVAYAAGQGVTIGFEPEPGMLIASMAMLTDLWPRIDAPNLGVTLDVGHLHCQGEMPIEDFVQRWGARLVNVHLEDMRAGAHEHLMFGEGEIDFPPVLRALADVGYCGGVYVELSRHSHVGADAARRAFEFLARRKPQ